MGPLRNVVKRKEHKERSQPLARKKYGLLEKKKDYRLRAKDYHRKEDFLQLLRRKAEDKNPDEFYFGMENVATRDGVHVKESAEANKYSQAELRLMKTQDVKYIALKAQQEAKKVEKLQQSLHSVDEAGKSQRIVFVDDPAEMQSFPEARNQADAQVSSLNDEQPDDEDDVNAGSGKALEKARLSKPDPKLEAKLRRHRKAAYNELTQRQERQQKLLAMAQHMQLKKELMGKGSKQKLKSEEKGGKPIYKWRLERKR